MVDSFNGVIVEEILVIQQIGDVEMIEEGDVFVIVIEIFVVVGSIENVDLFFVEGDFDDILVLCIIFLQYLSSFVVILLIGSNDEEIILMVYQGLLIQSLYFVDCIVEFVDDGSVCFFFDFQQQMKVNLLFL